MGIRQFPRAGADHGTDSLTLLGIIPAHTLFFQMGWGGEFTATSMIGWIALAGIIVRNSILLVDFPCTASRKAILSSMR